MAHAVDLFLRGLRPERAGRPYSTRIGRMENDELRHLAAETPRHGRVRLTTGWPGGFSDTEARLEAARCLHCECAKLNTCRLRQTGLEYGADTARYRGQRRPFRRDMSHPLLVYEPGKCIACGLCIQIARRSGEQLGLSFVGRGYDVEMAAPFGRPISEGLVVAACACAEACPTAALTLREDMAHAILPEPEPPIEFRRRAMPGRPFGRWRRRRTWGS